MKTLWNAISFVAVVNLLALGMFAAWMGHTQRISRDRLDAVRDLFALSLPEAEQVAEQARLDAERTQEDEASARRRADPPVDSAEQVLRRRSLQEQQQQTIRRLKDESDLLRRELAGQAETTRAERRAFEQERVAWQAAVADEQRREIDEQFGKAVLVLQGLPAKQAKDHLAELARAGEIDQAVAYLDAMPARTAQKILSQFKEEDDRKLATELLERMRTFGVVAAGDQETSDADTRPVPD